MEQKKLANVSAIVTGVVTTTLVILLGFMIAEVSVVREAAYEEGYQQGSQHTVELLTEIADAKPKIDPEQNALQWWVGTTDMAAVRKRLCGK